MVRLRPPKFTRWEVYTNEFDGSHRRRRAQGLVPIASTLPDMIAGIARATPMSADGDRAEDHSRPRRTLERQGRDGEASPAIVIAALPYRSPMGRDGRLLQRCHAGCPWDAVRDALWDRGLLEHPRYACRNGGVDLDVRTSAVPRTPNFRGAQLYRPKARLRVLKLAIVRSGHRNARLYGKSIVFGPPQAKK
jgi:hypothetical protein